MLDTWVVFIFHQKKLQPFDESYTNHSRFINHYQFDHIYKQVDERIKNFELLDLVFN